MMIYDVYILQLFLFINQELLILYIYIQLPLPPNLRWQGRCLHGPHGRGSTRAAGVCGVAWWAMVAIPRIGSG